MPRRAECIHVQHQPRPALPTLPSGSARLLPQHLVEHVKCTHLCLLFCSGGDHHANCGKPPTASYCSMRSAAQRLLCRNRLLKLWWPYCPPKTKKSFHQHKPMATQEWSQCACKFTPPDPTAAARQTPSGWPPAAATPAWNTPIWDQLFEVVRDCLNPRLLPAYALPVATTIESRTCSSVNFQLNFTLPGFLHRAHRYTPRTPATI